jgi:hypothetical protein
VTYEIHHWTDDAATPVFTTVINGRGPGANIFYIVGTAVAMLRQLAIPTDRIEALRENVANAGNYDQAVAFVEAWFPVRREVMRIGDEFTLGDHTYRVTDVGTRTVIAIRIDQVTVIRDGVEEALDQAQAEAAGWFRGPPYAVAEGVFDEDDLDAIECSS